MSRKSSDSSRTGRRVFLASVGAASAVGLAGCLGDEGGGDTTAMEPETPGNERLRDELGLEYPDYELEDELNVLQWTDYWHPNTVPDFEDAFGVSVSMTSFGSNEEMLEILRTEGFDAYDLAVPSDWMVTNLITGDRNRLTPLDLSKLQNWGNLGQRWIDDAPYDVGERRHSAPYLWGTTGIGWHEEMVEGSLPDIDHLDSWEAMWLDRYDGQIQMMDLPRETYAAALKRLGYSLNATDPDKIGEATDLLVQQKDLVSKYTGEKLIDGLVNKRASPMHTFSGTALAAQVQLLEDGNSPVAYRIPREGGVVWIDTMVVPKAATHPNAAHAFIDYILNPVVGALNANFNFYATPNEKAKGKVLEDLLNDPAVYPPDDVREKLEFIDDVGDARSHYDEGWQSVQNA